MTEEQLRRKELLRQAKQLSGDRDSFPPIHPRYGNLCKEQSENASSEDTSGSFYMRLVIGILCFYLFRIYGSEPYRSSKRKQYKNHK